MRPDPRILSLRLEVNTLVTLLRARRLAAHPLHACIADPFAYGVRTEVVPVQPFCFSDIPDVDFQERNHKAYLSSFEGGSKS